MSWSSRRWMRSPAALNHLTRSSPNRMWTYRRRLMNRPYFFQFEKGIPSSLIPSVALAAAATAWRWHWFRVAVAARPATLDRSAAIRCFSRMLGHRDSSRWRFMPFSRRGSSWAIRRSAVTLVLVTFLVGGGIGSGLSPANDLAMILERRPQLATAAVVICASAIWSCYGPRSALNFSPQLPRCARHSSPRCRCCRWRCAWVALSPSAETCGAHATKHQVALAWCVNGLMTVVGSVAAVALSITLGFSAVLWLGAAAYLLATLILAIIHRRSVNHDSECSRMAD